MSLVGRLLGLDGDTVRHGHHGDSAAAYWGRARSATGLDVTPETALGNSAVLQAVQLIAGTIASLPCVLYQAKGRHRQVAEDQRLYEVLRWQPNPEMTASQFRTAQWWNQLLHGARYAEIERTRGGEIHALWHLPSDCVRPRRLWIEGVGRQRRAHLRPPAGRERDPGEIWYEVSGTRDGTPAWIPWWRMFHTMWLSRDGLHGLSPLRLAAEPIALGLAAQQHSAATYGNDSTPRGVLERPVEAPPLSPEAEAALVAHYEAMHRGAGRTGRLAVLQEGTVFKPVSLSPADAQLLEQRRFQVEEVARIFHVPVHLLGHLDRATFSNIEHQGQEFLMLGLMPRLVAEEQEIRRKLIIGRAPSVPLLGRDYYAEFDFRALLRADIKTRMESYRLAIEAGFMTPDEAAASESLPPVPDEQGGRTYRAPMNYAAAGVALAPDRRLDKSAPDSTNDKEP